MITRLRRRKATDTRGERGQSSVEFIFMLPFVFVIIFLVAEMTAAMKTWMVIENASREGARAAALRNTEADVVANTIARSGDILTAGNISVVNEQGTPGTATSVAITYTYTFQSPLAALVNFVSGGTITTTMNMYAQTSMRLE